MAAVIEDVRSGKMGYAYKAASTLYNVPKSTLERRVKTRMLPMSTKFLALRAVYSPMQWRTN